MEEKKWTVIDAGPRQLKAAKKAINSILWEGKGILEISGVIGQIETERRHKCIPFMGALSEFAHKAYEAFGSQFDWKITAANASSIVKIAEALVLEISKNPIVHDNRITPQQQAEEQARIAESFQKNADEAAKKAETKAKLIAELRAEYPWAAAIAAKGLSPHARAAASIRTELSKAFPGITFGIRSSSFAGGDDVTIKWTLGPTVKQVEAITGKYTGGSFDGMQDIYEYDRSAMGQAIDEVLGRTKYISESREFPPELRKHLQEEIRRMFPGDNESQIERAAYQALEATEFAVGELYAGVDWPVGAQFPTILKSKASTDVAPTPTVSACGATVTRNIEKDGIEIRFPSRPDDSVIELLKSNKWRWSRFSKCWYTKYSESAESFATDLIGEPAETVAA